MRCLILHASANFFRLNGVFGSADVSFSVMIGCTSIFIRMCLGLLPGAGVPGRPLSFSFFSSSNLGHFGSFGVGKVGMPASSFGMSRKVMFCWLRIASTSVFHYRTSPFVGVISPRTKCLVCLYTTHNIVASVGFVSAALAVGG